MRSCDAAASMLSREHRRFLIVDQLVGAAIVNFLINAGLAWSLFRHASTVALYAPPEIAVDTVVTALVLPLVTALVAGYVVRLRVARGELPPLAASTLRASAWSRRSTLSRGTLLGIAAVVLVALPTVAVFALVGPDRLARGSFIWFKASFAAGLGMLVTPPLGWWALIDASRAAPSPRA